MKRATDTAAILGLTLGSFLLGGCPDPPSPAEPCAGPDDPQLTLSNRQGALDLAASAEVEVFPPPQGGVFAELDVIISDLALSELEYLRVTVDDATTGENYAFVRFFGDSIPLRCTEEQEVLEVQNLPVGFVEMFTLEDLDGKATVVTGSVETQAGEFPVEYAVTLARTDY